MKKSKWVIFTLVLLLLLNPISAVLADTLYTVQPGDNLTKIARKFDTTVEAIVEANDIADPGMIRVGEILKIPADGQPTAPPPDAEGPQSPSSFVDAVVDTVIASAAPQSGQHVVQLGDSLSKIAVQYGLDYLSLALLNAIEEPFILQVGEILEVPNPLARLAPKADLPGEIQEEPAPQVQAEIPPPANAAKVSPAIVQPAGVRVYETIVTIPTYDYEAAFLPTSEDDSVYPYPRLDFEQVGEVSPRTYKAVVLENGYVSVTILPELGGRVYRWKDKASGRELLYQNPVIKPTNWGYRGWWLAAGGIEWAFPVEEHGLNEWRPWSYSKGSDSVTVSNVEDHTGMEVGATISLSANDAVMTIQPWARNNTESAQQYQLWLNAMLALSNNSVSGETQFIVPTNQVVVHSTGDDGLPGPGETMSWPVHNGRDMSHYGNWDDYLGFFAPKDVGYSGLYDHSNGQGIVRTFSPGWPAGTKFFGPGTLPTYLWTDDSSNYVEMWSGATGSFWDSASLEPGQTVSWSEYWYPVNDLGGYNFANRLAAMRLDDTSGGVEVGLAVSTPIEGKLTLWAGNDSVASWPVNMGPGQALQASWSRPSGQDGALGLRLEDNNGAVLSQMGQVP